MSAVKTISFVEAAGSTSSGELDRIFIENDLVSRIVCRESSGATPHSRTGTPITDLAALSAEEKDNADADFDSVQRSPVSKSMSKRRRNKLTQKATPPHIREARRALDRGGPDAAQHRKHQLRSKHAKEKVAHVFANLSYSESENEADEIPAKKTPVVDFDQNQPPKQTMTKKDAEAHNMQQDAPEQGEVEHSRAALLVFGNSFLRRVAAQVQAHVDYQFMIDNRPRKDDAVQKQAASIMGSTETRAVLDGAAIGALTLLRPDLIDEANGRSRKATGPDASALELLHPAVAGARKAELQQREVRLEQMRKTKRIVSRCTKAPDNAAVRLYRQHAPLTAMIAAGAVLGLRSKTVGEQTLFVAALTPTEDGVAHSMALSVCEEVGVRAGKHTNTKLVDCADVHNTEDWRQEALRYGILPGTSGVLAELTESQVATLDNFVERREKKRKREAEQTEKKAAKQAPKDGPKKTSAQKRKQSGDAPDGNDVATVELKGKNGTVDQSAKKKKVAAVKAATEKKAAKSSVKPAVKPAAETAEKTVADRVDVSKVLHASMPGATIFVTDELMGMLGRLFDFFSNPGGERSALFGPQIMHKKMVVTDADLCETKDTGIVEVNLLARMFYSAACNIKPAKKEYIETGVESTLRDLQLNRAARAIDRFKACRDTNGIMQVTGFKGPVHERFMSHVLFGFLAMTPKVAAAAPKSKTPKNTLPAGVALRMNERLVLLIQTLYCRYCKDTLGIDVKDTNTVDGARRFWAERAKIDFDDGEKALFAALLDPSSEDDKIVSALDDLIVPVANSLFYPTLQQ